MSAHWKLYPTANEAAHACAEHVISILESATAGNTDARIALSGGSTPKLLFAHMAAAKFDWSQVNIFWVDERGVPPDHADSNYRMTFEHLAKPAHIPQRNLYRVHAELQPKQAAQRYEEDIRECFNLDTGELPHFDLVCLGVGADAHTASLFPGEPLIEDREHIAAAVFVEKLAQWRITLLPGVLLAARHAAVLVSGEDKAVALQKVFREPYAPQQYPAQIIAHHSRRAEWFLDEGAGRLLE